ncbi:MAG TPA: hypothetical protein VKE22_21140, partial [Haliangiales bacterium]|nr:hypothetical protein [Haliangiales bacterium]
MERAPRAHQGVAAAALIWLASFPAHADPILQVPELGKVTAEGELGTIGLLAEMRALGVLVANRLAEWPDRRLGLEAQRPALIAGRVGGVADLADAPVTFVLRVDFGELARPSLPDGVGQVFGAVIDDAYAFFRPFPALQILAGRAPVPFAKERQYDEIDEPLGAPPFLVDRVTPDRRYGVLVLGDLGGAAYALGAYEDLDAVEPRRPLDDPSAGGAFALALHVEWTPRAPMMGSNPPGKVEGARGPLPTPSTDPWWDEARVSVGLGGLLRVREDGSTRLDGSFSLQLKWRWLAALGETIATSGTPAQVGVHGTLMVTPIDLLALAVRGEWDPGALGGGQW